MSVLCGVSGCSKSVAITKSLMGVKSSQRPSINAIASVPTFRYWLGNSPVRERTSRWCFLQRQPLSTLSRHIAFKFIVRIRCHKPLERRVTRIRVHSAMHEAHAHTAKFGLSNGKQCKEGGSRRLGQAQLGSFLRIFLRRSTTSCRAKSVTVYYKVRVPIIIYMVSNGPCGTVVYLRRL